MFDLEPPTLSAIRRLGREPALKVQRMVLKPRSTYHHGDLRRSLIEAAETLLAERGADAFSLREVARRAGVSPAAPAHHFGDASGLLAAVSQAGFEALTEALREGERRAGPRANARAKLVGQGVGYVNFALAQPGKFRQMFRSGQRHQGPKLTAPELAAPDLADAATAAFGMLESGIRAVCDVPANKPLDAHARTALVTMWSVVHGFAHLAIAGRLTHLAGDAALKSWVGKTLPAVLEATIAGLAGGSRRRGSRPGQ
jgi:AcrR family transcriptional regulator